jgi:hypothetical protein
MVRPGVAITGGMFGWGPLAARRSPAAQPQPGATIEVAYGPTLALTVTLALAWFLVLMSLVLLIVHPTVSGPLVTAINEQNKTAKAALYVLAFVVILPLALLAGPRLARAIEAGPNAGALSPVAAVLSASLATALILIRLSRGLPWSDGLGTVCVGILVWLVAAGAVLLQATRHQPSATPGCLRRMARSLWVCAGALVFAALVCVTTIRTLRPAVVTVGAIFVACVVLGYERWRPPRLRRPVGDAVDAVVMTLLLLAIVNVVVFRATSSLPNIYLEPGIIQFQHDYILGPVNQLLGGGALLVNVPVSQYGVGMLYFLGAWFHLAPIGYGTFGLLDGLLTAIFYMAAYGVLRIAGLGRLLAGSALLVGVVALILNLHYAVGALPEQGPLRFGLPMGVLVASVAATRWPRWARAFRVVQSCVLGVASVWALEAFAYTALTFIALAAAEAWLRPAGERRRWLGGQLLRGLLACLAAHAMVALATLIGSGHLPDWGQYLAFAHAVLLGGGAGAISYGFATWSPGLAFGAGAMASAAGVVLLCGLRPCRARQERLTFLALTGTTAYTIALLSYIDNRSSTYLLPYVALPLLLAGALWLGLLLRLRSQTSSAARRGGLAFALAVAVLLIAVAWPRAGARLSNTALAHAYPGGGLPAAMHRLWHPPAIDPRAPEGQRLLSQFMPGRRRVVILLPRVPDLGTEILMRSRRVNLLFVGDPKADGLVPSVWLPKLRREVAQLRPGQRVLTDMQALAMLPALRRLSPAAIAARPIDQGTQEVEWLLRAIDQRFRFTPVYRAADGLRVAELVPRGP